MICFCFFLLVDFLFVDGCWWMEVMKVVDKTDEYIMIIELYS